MECLKNIDFYKGDKKMVDNKYVIDSGKEIISECPHKNIRPKMELTGNAVLKLRYLQDKFKDVEFLVYGNATKIDGFNYVLDDIVVPEQVVGLASVDNIIVKGQYNTVIHKHPGNSTGFSAIDEQFINSNHDFSIVIGNDNKLNNTNGNASIQIECGRYMKAKLDINVVIPSSKDEAFIKSAGENIKIAIAEQKFLSKIFGGKKDNMCSRCGQPLEKKGNEWHCGKCAVVYVQA